MGVKSNILLDIFCIDGNSAAENERMRKMDILSAEEKICAWVESITEMREKVFRNTLPGNDMSLVGVVMIQKIMRFSGASTDYVEEDR